jgi:zinc transport system substrate-binding protein
MRKKIAYTLAGIMVISSISGCGKIVPEVTETAGTDQVVEEAVGAEDKLQVVTTIFPEYDWVKEVMGEQADQAEITMLLDNGVDLHSYQPTAGDIKKIANCDLFIYVGGESDEWVENALAEAVNPDMEVINLLEVLGNSVKEEEVVEGMEAEEEEEEAGAEGEEEEVEYDEHVWLSLRNTQTLCSAIADSLGKVDAEHADLYAKNATEYNAKLDALDQEYKAVVEAAKNKTVLFGDRFPFRYLVDDYGLSYYAAFVGCSAESEASFDTIVFLAKKVDELGLSTILTIEGDNHGIAESIRENTEAANQEIKVLDSMQATTGEDVANGTTYLGVMTDNLEVLKSALN